MSKISPRISVISLTTLTLALFALITYKINLTGSAEAYYDPLNIRKSADSRIAAAVSQKTCALSLNLLRPVVEESVGNHTFPPQKIDHTTIDSMKMDSFTFDAFDLRFAYPEPQNLTVGIIDIALKIPKTKFKFKYGIFNCKGTFSIALNKTSVYLNVMPYILPNGSLSMAVGKVDITWGNMEIHHKTNNFVCKVEEKVARIFVGEINKFAEKNLRKRLPKILASELQTRVETFLWSIPSHFYTLNMTSDRLFVDMDLLPGSLPQHRTPSRSSIPLLSSFSRRMQLQSRDIVVDLPSTSISNYLQRAQAANLLNYTFILPPGINSTTLRFFFPEAYNICPNCLLALMLAPSKGIYVNYSTDMKPDLHLYNNSIKMSFQEFNVSFMMLADTTKKVGNILQAIQLNPTPSSRDLEDLANEVMRRDNPLLLESHILESLTAKHSTDASVNIIPLALFSVDFVVGVANVSFEGSKRNELSFDTIPLHDLNIRLLETNIGPLNTTECERKVLSFVNLFVIPMINTQKLFKLPITDGFIEIEDDDLITGVDLG